MAGTRDREILAVFESTDDALQGLIGYHFFVKETAQKLGVSHLLSDRRLISLQITHEWLRTFEVRQFFQHIADSAELQHCRTMLLAIIQQFEVALRRMKRRLWRLDKLGSRSPAYKEPDYKPLLRWAFQIVRNTSVGSLTMRRRLPDVCGDVDDARRLRNLSMHENNYFTQKYVDDAIRMKGVSPQFVPSYVDGKKIFLTNPDIEKFLYSHIEFLHMLHNTLQRSFFGCREDYNYSKEGKQPELFRLISGRKDVDV